MEPKTKWLLTKTTSTSCTMPGVWKAAAFCEGAAVIFHSPLGCTHVASFMDMGARFRVLADGGKEFPHAVPLISSNLREKDSIFGGADRLRDCMKYTVETYHPKCIIVASSCVAGVIGDDVEGVCEDAEMEYGIPILCMPFAGFLGGEYGDGYYKTANAIVDRFFRKQEKVKGRVVLLGDQMGPAGQYAREAARLLEKFGLEVRYQFPGYVPFEEWKEIPSAEYSVMLGFAGNAGELLKLADRLEKEFDVKSLGNSFPVGWQATKEWILKVGEMTGQEERAKEVLSEEERDIENYISTIKDRTMGRKAAIVTGRPPRWYNPGETAESLSWLGISISSLILLDNLKPEEKVVLTENFRKVSDAPIIDGKDSGPVMDSSDILLVTNEIYSTKTKQLFIPMIPLAGTAGEKAMLRAIAHLICRYGTKGGIAYVEA